MTRVRLLVSLLLLLAVAIPMDGTAQPAGVRYNLYVNCGASPPVAIPGTPVTGASGGCPIRATDGDDLMGDPSLAVDPLQPENLILASLHGQSAGNSGGPSMKARGGQVFTTFTSQDQGQSWIDNPYVPPDDIGFAYGMHPQVTIDPYGQVYVGSLYAIPLGQNNGTNIYDYVIGAQKFGSIDTIDEEQITSSGGYNAEYITPVFAGNQINQMWFLFNPITDNMTLVWHETLQKPIEPPCLTDSAYLQNIAGNYVKLNPLTQEVAIYQESNGMPDLQTPASCPRNPDGRLLFSLAEAAAQAALPATGSAAPVAVASAPPAAAPVAAAPSPPSNAILTPAAMAGRLNLRPGAAVPAPADELLARDAFARAVPLAALARAQPGNETGNETDNETSSSSPTPAQPAPDAPDEDDPTPVGAIGLVWTTSDSDTPYYYQDLEDTIRPCSSSTNPVLSFGYLYIGCVVDTSLGAFRWDPTVRNGTVQLFRMDPNGGTPEYMGQAPDMVGIPKLGVRSDGRLALLAAGATPEGALLVSAAFGRYDESTLRITWGREVAVGNEILAFNPEKLIVDAKIQDVIYREQSGALHFILKTTVNYVAGLNNTLDGLNLLPHIQKRIVAVDEDYGYLAAVPIEVGNPLVRQSDATILSSPEDAFQDLSDDFLQLPPGPYSYNGKDLGAFYQREFFAIGDYGTVLFAEIVEDTDLRAPAFYFQQPPPPPIPAAATTNIVAPVAGVAGIGAVLSTLVAHRRKNPLAAITKGE